jgi:hypothetical protein
LIKEISNSLKAALYERVTAPILGAYTLTWLIYNWKGLLPLIFSQKDIENRVQSFESYLYSGGWQASPNNLLFNGWFRLDFFIIPLIFTVVVTVLSPYLQSLLFNWKESLKASSLKKKEGLDSELRLTLEQSIELKKMLKLRHEIYQEDKDQEKAIYENEKEKLNRTIKEIKAQKSSIEDILSTHQDNFNEIRENNNILQKELSESGSEIAILIEERQRANKTLLKAKDDLSKFKQGIVISTELKSTFISLISTIDIESLYDLTLKISSWFEDEDEENNNLIQQGILNPILIQKFSKSTTYDYADNFFEKIIVSNIKSFNDENFEQLAIAWSDNDQIHDRRRADDDLAKIRSLTNRSTDNFNIDFDYN